MAKSEPHKKQDEYQPKYQHVVYKNWTDEQINYLADELLDYFLKNNDKYVNESFLAHKLISKATFVRLRGRSEYLSTIYDYVESIKLDRLASWLKDKEQSTAGVIFALKNVAKWNDGKSIDEDTEEFELINNWDKKH